MLKITEILVHANKIQHSTIQNNDCKKCSQLTQVMLGGAYRTYDKLTSWMGVATKHCNHVTRGGNRSPITTCVGKCINVCHAFCPFFV